MKRRIESEGLTYPSEREAAVAWAEQYRKASERIEFAAFIYAIPVNGEPRYRLGRTYPGMKAMFGVRANVIGPFVSLFMVESAVYRLKYGAELVAFIHTHPRPQAGFTLRHHSREDLALLRLPGIKTVYVIPFENEEVNRVTRVTV